MVETQTQTQNQQQAEKRKVNVKNVSQKGTRFLFDAGGKQVMFGPGHEQEVEVFEPVAKQLEDQSQGGSDLRIEGFDPPEQEQGGPEIPDEQKSRPALAEAERDELEEGAEADKERREKDAKKKGEQLAAETGIHMHARNVKPDVKLAPEDAPPKKKSS